MTSDLPAPGLLTDEELAAEIRALVAADKKSARRWACDRPDCDGLPHPGWLHHHARATQRLPKGWWTVWLYLAGRGTGKTRSCAEAVRVWVQTPGTHVCVLAKNATTVRDICFEHRTSGLLAVIPPEEIASYNRTLGDTVLTLVNGSVIRGFGAETPDNLRGPAFDKAWIDEYAAWRRRTAQATYDQLWFTLREAELPQVVVSTTPKPLPHVRKLVEEHTAQQADPARRARPNIVLVKERTVDNLANLSRFAYGRLLAMFSGTRLGRQELDADLLADVEGALWQAWMFETERFRLEDGSPLVPSLDRLVVAVDPATTSGDGADFTAFCVAGRSDSFDATYADGLPHAYVLDAEQGRYTPERAMARAAALYHQHQADAVVIEANNGGDYLPTVLRMVDPTVQYRLVHATRGKRSRAAPVAALYERERVHHVGPPARFDELENQMVTYVGSEEPVARSSEATGDGEPLDRSPDLLDAAVWALTDLLLDPVTNGIGTVVDARLEPR